MRHPDCARAATSCRTTASHYVQEPLIAWTPLTDGTGQQLNDDPNTHVRAITCSTCGRTWEEHRSYGRVTLVDTTPTPLPAA